MSAAKDLYIRAQDNLEFPEVLNKLVEYAKSASGKEICLNLEASSDIEEVLHRQKDTADTLKVLVQRDGSVISSFPEITESIKKAKVSSSVLNLEELYYIRVFLEKITEVSKLNPSEDSDYYLEDNNFYHEIERLVVLNRLEKTLSRVVLSTDEIAENASPNLRRIRTEIKKVQERIKRDLSKILEKSSDILQEQIVTLRRGRYVIPVKAENKHKIPGIVHDSSQSGQTLFIEPLAVVEANNNLRELYAEEEREIWRILSDLTQLVREDADLIIDNNSIMAKLDFMQAKASLARKMQAIQPKLNNKGHINLIKARHPHIETDQVVPIDLSLGDGFRSLLITGPNTGGKTVSLKTCGLLTLMAMSGLHIPAAANSEVSVFEQIFTDIGDEQSIAEDLSTFSAHMQSLVTITENVNEQTLVLVDELGSGTDPKEGAALAISVLDYLQSKNAVTLVTTHYKELKVYALETPGVENASMEFDEKTLMPTYRVLVGVPGTSHAFSIAKRMGLNGEIIAKAREQLSEDEINFEKVLREIEESRLELEKIREENEILQRDLDSEINKTKQIKEQYEAAKYKLNSDTRNEKRSMLKQQSQAVDELITDFENKLKKLENVDFDDIKALRSMLRSELKDVEAEIGADTLQKFKAYSGKVNEKSKELGMGDDAFAPSLGLEGTIITEPDKQNQVQFKSGQLTVTLPLSALEASRGKAKVDDKSKQQSRSVRSKVRSNFSPEIKLLGDTVEEALYKLDDYIDDAVLANVERVRIVHGKGTGALKQAVHEFLRKDRRVVKYELAEFGDGDAGVTYAYLRA